MAKTKSDTVKGLVDNPEKAARRFEIGTQTVNYLKATGISKLVSASLPAHTWAAERLLLNLIREENIPTLKEMIFHGAEKDDGVVYDTLKHRPTENSTVFKNEIDDLLEQRSIVYKNGVGQLDADHPSVDAYNFIWEDRCTAVSHKTLYKCGYHMSLMEKGMMYLTVSLTSRQLTYEKLCTSVQLCRKRPDKSIIKHLTNITKKHGTNITPVYSALYHGGDGGRKPMVTVGFLVGDHYASVKRAVGIIDKDVRINPLKQQSARTVSRFKQNTSLWTKRKKTATKTQTPKTTLAQQNAVYELLSQGMPNADIAVKLGISRGSVGSLQAHYKYPERFKGPKKVKK